MNTPTLGQVVEFDDQVGAGVVVGQDGLSYPFHCVAISDGSRLIEEGADVSFVVVRRLGRREAWAVTRRP